MQSRTVHDSYSAWFTQVASSTTLQLVDAAVGLDDDEEMDEETLRTLYEKESYLRRKFEREVLVVCFLCHT